MNKFERIWDMHRKAFDAPCKTRIYKGRIYYIFQDHSGKEIIQAIKSPQQGTITYTQNDNPVDWDEDKHRDALINGIRNDAEHNMLKIMFN